jgi:hypothetical protein
VNWQADIERHYRSNWKATPESSLYAAGPVHQLPPHFTVLRFPPHGDRTMWTYATRGMSLPDDSRPIELHMFSARETQEIDELLFMTAHFHRASAKLGLAHTVNFGKPWVAGSTCEYGLVSLPYMDGPDLEDLVVQGRTIKFYWMIPITQAEREFKVLKGLGALESEFERTSFDYLDPRRRSVV